MIHGAISVGVTPTDVGHVLHVHASRSNSHPIFIGGPDVTIDDGYPLYPGESLTIDAELFAVAAVHGQASRYIGEIV